MFAYRRAILILLPLGLAACCAFPPRAEPAAAPLTLSYRSTHDGKPPLRNYIVQFDLVNSHDAAMWYIFPEFGGKPLPATDQFTFDAEHPQLGDHIFSQREHA